MGRNFGSEMIGQRLERDARAELYASLLGKSMTFHSLRPVGEIMARATNDVHELNLMLNPGVNLIVGSGMFLLIPLLVVPTIHPTLLLTPVLFVIGYYWAVRRLLRELSPVTEAPRAHFGIMNAGLEESIEGIETVKGAAREGEEVHRFEQNAASYRDAYIRQGQTEARSLTLVLLPIAITVAFGQALWLYLHGAIDISQVVSYNSLIWLYGFPSFVSVAAFSQVSLGLVGARRILDLINAETEMDHNPRGHIAPIKGAITFDNVCFAYADSPSKPVLGEIHFSVRPGQTAAI